MSDLFLMPLAFWSQLLISDTFFCKLGGGRHLHFVFTLSQVFWLEVKKGLLTKEEWSIIVKSKLCAVKYSAAEISPLNQEKSEHLFFNFRSIALKSVGLFMCFFRCLKVSSLRFVFNTSSKYVHILFYDLKHKIFCYWNFLFHKKIICAERGFFRL